MCDSGKSLDVSVCHTIINMTSPSICQSHDLSVCQPKCDSTWNSIHQSVCPSSLLSIQPSAKSRVKIPTSVAGQNFPNVQFPGKLLSVHTSLDSSVDPSDSPSITSSMSAGNLSNSLVKRGETCSKLPAQNPSEITHSPYFVSYVCQFCTCPCIVHSIHPSIR